MSVAISKKSRCRALAHQKKAAALVGVAAVAVAATAATAAPKHERPASEGFGPMRVNRYCEARAIANTAVGLKEFEVTVPMSAGDAQASNLHGRKSYEYAAGHAVPTGGDAKKFNRRGIGRETAKINKLAELDEVFRRMTDAEQKQFELFVKERRKEDAEQNETQGDAFRSRQQMGDFLDDAEGWENAENAQDDLLLLEEWLA